MQNFFTWLSGKKTYIVASATALYAILGWSLGHMDQDSAIQLLSMAAGMAGLRHGISSKP